ncbi:MAG: NAD(P)-dependent oxidoreductase, partial [Thermodesulfovibrionales bacterium]
EKQKGSIQHLQRPYKIGDTKNFFLVIAATDDEAVNRQISQEAKFLLNVVDNPGLSNFIVPAVLKDGDLTIAISTGGISPAIARSIKTDLKSYISIDIKRYLRFLKSLRKDVFKSNLSFKIRNEFLKFSGSMEILQMLRNDGYGKTKKMVLRKFKEIKKA